MLTRRCKACKRKFKLQGNKLYCTKECCIKSKLTITKKWTDVFGISYQEARNKDIIKKHVATSKGFKLYYLWSSTPVVDYISRCKRIIKRAIQQNKGTVNV